LKDDDGHVLTHAGPWWAPVRIGGGRRRRRLNDTGMSGAWCTTVTLAVCFPVSAAIFAAESSFGPNPVVDVDSGWLVGSASTVTRSDKSLREPPSQTPQ
jgi:hypothetical protein